MQQERICDIPPSYPQFAQESRTRPLLLRAAHRRVRVQVPGCILLDPIDEPRGFFSKRCGKSIDRERRVRSQV